MDKITEAVKRVTDMEGIYDQALKIMDNAENSPETGYEVGHKVYPNDPCPCGSGKKYKKCCGKV